uniref:Uncharacterized protein n=1 Tax=Setaria italica TaxID=4555 RepID=K3Z126_SETIT
MREWRLSSRSGQRGLPKGDLAPWARLPPAEEEAAREERRGGEEGGSPLTSKSRRESIKGGGEGEGGELPVRTKREKASSVRKRESE